MNRLVLLAVVVSTSLSLGCATMINGTTQTIEVETDPPGADFVVYPTNQTGKTPAELELERNQTYTVRIGHAGYQDEFVHLSPRFSNWFNVNALVGGLIGISHDVDSGGAMKLVPGEIDIIMRRSPRLETGGEATP